MSIRKDIRLIKKERKKERERKNTWLDTLRTPVYNIAPKVIINNVALINVGAQQMMLLKCPTCGMLLDAPYLGDQFKVESPSPPLPLTDFDESTFLESALKTVGIIHPYRSSNI